MGDSMPIGSIVEYNGTDIPDGWEILPGDANVYIGSKEPENKQEVWIQKSENILPLTIITKTVDGITITNNQNGTFDLKGTATAEANFSTMLKLGRDINLVNGATYTLSANKYNLSHPYQVHLAFSKEDGTWLSTPMVLTTEPKTTTLIIPSEAAYLQMVIRVNSGYVMDLSGVGLQLQRGSVATDFAPKLLDKIYVKNNLENYDKILDKKDMGDIAVNTIKCKNLFNMRRDGYSPVSTKRKIVNDVLRIESGTTANNASHFYAIPFGRKELLGKTITLSARWASSVEGHTGRIYIGTCDEDFSNRHSYVTLVENGGSVTITLPTQFMDNNVKFFAAPYACYNESTTAGDYIDYFDVQIEEGTESTDYTPWFDATGGGVYTSQEHKIGEWINGKPIYRKVLTNTAAWYAGEVVLEHGIEGLEIMIRYDIFTKSRWFFPYSYTTESGAQEHYGSLFRADDTNVYIGIINDSFGAGGEKYIVLEYTKTTD